MLIKVGYLIPLGIDLTPVEQIKMDESGVEEKKPKVRQISTSMSLIEEECE